MTFFQYSWAWAISPCSSLLTDNLFLRLRELPGSANFETVLFDIHRGPQVEHSARTASCRAATIAMGYPNFLII